MKVNKAIKKFLAEIGRKGGKKSRCKISAEQQQKMQAARRCQTPLLIDNFLKIRSNLTPMAKMTLAEFQSRGGKSKSPAKIRAVLANLKKAREAKKGKKKS